MKTKFTLTAYMVVTLLVTMAADATTNNTPVAARCTQDGVVSPSLETSKFIDGNKDKLAQDMSKGGGESLQSLAQLICVKDADKAAFYRATKENFAQIFVSEQVSAEQVAAGLKRVLAANGSLAQYAAAI